MFAIGNDEIEKAPELGKTINCKRCGKKHKVKYGDEVKKDGTRVPSKLVAFVKCRKQAYLVGINGKRI